MLVFNDGQPGCAAAGALYIFSMLLTTPAGVLYMLIISGVYAVYRDSTREKQIVVIVFVRWDNFRSRWFKWVKSINYTFATLSKIKLGCAGASGLAILFRIIGLSKLSLPPFSR